jgi:hypothetical protein
MLAKKFSELRKTPDEALRASPDNSNIYSEFLELTDTPKGCQAGLAASRGRAVINPSNDKLQFKVTAHSNTGLGVQPSERRTVKEAARARMQNESVGKSFLTVGHCRPEG